MNWGLFMGGGAGVTLKNFVDVMGYALSAVRDGEGLDIASGWAIGSVGIGARISPFAGLGFRNLYANGRVEHVFGAGDAQAASLGWEQKVFTKKDGIKLALFVEYGVFASQYDEPYNSKKLGLIEGRKGRYWELGFRVRVPKGFTRRGSNP